MTFVSHPLITPDTVEDRAYQAGISKSCLKGNTLVILPTGLGKTVIALRVAADILNEGGKVLFLAPTKPLVDQHFRSFTELLSGPMVGVMNGNMEPVKRKEIMTYGDVIISTPQAVANDLENSVYDLSGVRLLIYDEAHRSVGNYAYVTVAGYHNGLTMAMTASPGSDLKRTEEVCENLSIEQIEVRNEEDPDVSPYVHDIYTNKIEVTVPQELGDIVTLLNRMLDGYIRELVNLRLMDPNWPASTTHLLMIGDSLRKRLTRGEKTNVIFRGMTVQAIAMKLLHAIGLAETQGVTVLRTYLKKIEDESADGKGGKAAKEITGSKEFAEICKAVSKAKTEHPKISRLMGLVSREIGSGRNSRIIVFSHYRETCDLLIEKLSSIDGVRVGKLIGQSKGGLRQKQQIELLRDFRSGEYNVIVSTSVGEEGLDVASTDVVIFYEPVPSEIRTIQRRGRTGRKNDGEVYVLVTKGTRDEVFQNSSRKKEDMMRSRLEQLGRELSRKRMRGGTEQMSIGEFRI
jgi:Fanconi anemia group M protein